MTVRNTDQETSHASADAVGALAAKLRGQILDLALGSGSTGLTSNEAERLITMHKANGVSPRFAELVERGHLLRVLIGYGKSTKKFPGGTPRYMTRWDEQTRRNVIVHWVPKFAPTKKPATSAQAEMTFDESETA